MLAPNGAAAEDCDPSSLYDSQHCPTGSGCWINQVGNTKDAIFVYIESAVASDLTYCSPNTPDDTAMTDAMFQRAVEEAADIWNRQGLATPLIVMGPINYASPENACDTGMPLKPAVFVHYERGCDPADFVNCVSPSPATASVRTIDDCDDAVRLTLFGNTTTVGSCAQSNGINYRIGSQDNVSIGSRRSVKRILVHEFGHVLGMGHHVNPTGNTVMNNSPHTQLWYTDQFCSTVYTHGRDVHRYRYQESDSNGPFSSTKTHSNVVQKGFYSGGLVRSAGGSPYYSLYTDDVVRYGYANNDGVLSFSSTSSPLHGQLQQQFIAPVIFAPLEYTPSSYNANRMNYSAPAYGLDAPVQKYARSNGSGIFNSVYVGTLYECLDASCVFFDTLESNISMNAAWDETSGNTVFAHVSTTDPYYSSGAITLYPGFYGGSNYLLRQGVTLPTGSLPSTAGAEANWSYQARTDVQVGIGCLHDPGTLYPCILAWNDSGVLNGKVLYVFFKVNTNNEIEWYGGSNPTVYIRSGSDTSGPPAVGYSPYDEKLWLAWRESGANGTIKRVPQYGTYSSWYYYDTITSADYIVDHPTFLYSPRVAREWGLMWTEVTPN